MKSSCFFLLHGWQVVSFALLLLGTAGVATGKDFDYDNMMNQNCPNFRCSSGYSPAPKSRPKFESMGCSSMGGGALMMNPGANGDDDKPYEHCCHQWHACYQICGISKQTCDTTFETCSKQACGLDEKCNKDVELNNMMMKLGGCKKYDQAQYGACECAPSHQVAQKREQAIRYFYKKFAPDNVDKAKDLAAKADTASKLAGLFRKLLLKYPEAIVKKEDPYKAMFDKMKNDADKGKSSDDTQEEDTKEEEDGTESSEEEKIEL